MTHSEIQEVHSFWSLVFYHSSQKHPQFNNKYKEIKARVHLASKVQIHTYYVSKVS